MRPLSTRDDLCQGHDECDPRAFSSHSANVFAEKVPVVREGDALEDHGCPLHGSHDATISRGHSTVFVNNRPIGHKDALVSCDSEKVATGRKTVFVG